MPWLDIDMMVTGLEIKFYEIKFYKVIVLIEHFREGFQILITNVCHFYATIDMTWI